MSRDAAGDHTGWYAVTGRHSVGRTFFGLSARKWFWIGVLTIEFVIFAILGWWLA